MVFKRLLHSLPRFWRVELRNAPVDSLRNIGPKTAEKLASVDILTAGDLKKAGAAETYARLKSLYPDRIKLNTLWVLQGAIVGVDWREVPPVLRVELRREVWHILRGIKIIRR